MRHNLCFNFYALQPAPPRATVPGEQRANWVISQPLQAFIIRYAVPALVLTLHSQGCGPANGLALRALGCRFYQLLKLADGDQLAAKLGDQTFAPDLLEYPDVERHGQLVVDGHVQHAGDEVGVILQDGDRHCSLQRKRPVMGRFLVPGCGQSYCLRAS